MPLYPHYSSSSATLLLVANVGSSYHTCVYPARPPSADLNRASSRVIRSTKALRHYYNDTSSRQAAIRTFVRLTFATTRIASLPSHIRWGPDVTIKTLKIASLPAVYFYIMLIQPNLLA